MDDCKNCEHMNGVRAMNYIESIYKYCKMADILEQARDFVQSDYDSGKIFSDEDTRNGYTDTIYFLEIAREKVLEMAEKWVGKDK